MISISHNAAKGSVILRMNGQNLTKFCIHIIIDKIYVGIVKHHILANLQQSYDP